MDHYLTKNKLEELKEELQECKMVKRKEIAKRLKLAKELGDLSENAEYHEARDQQQRLETRIYELEETIRNAKLITMTHGSKTVEIGTSFVLSRDGKKMDCTLVGSEEVDPAKGFLSHESPLGKSLLGHKKGDIVSFETPKGISKYKIVKIN